MAGGCSCLLLAQTIYGFTDLILFYFVLMLWTAYFAHMGSPFEINITE